MTVYLSRATLDAADPDRRSLYAWSERGGLNPWQPAARLVGKKSYALTATGAAPNPQSNGGCAYAVKVTVPATVPAGKYTLQVSGAAGNWIDAGPVTVTAAPRTVRRWGGAAFHRLTTLALKTDETLDCRGVTFAVTPDSRIRWGSAASLLGGTFVADDPDADCPRLFDSEGRWPLDPFGLTVRGCEFVGLGFGGPTTVRHCRFTRSQVNFSGPSLLDGCEFHGTHPQRAYPVGFAFSPAGAVAMIGNRYHGTHRGPVGNTVGDAVRGVLSAFNVYTGGGLQSVGNGEGWLVEGDKPAADVLLLCENWTGWRFSCLTLWDVPAERVTLAGCSLDAGDVGVHLFPRHGPQSVRLLSTTVTARTPLVIDRQAGPLVAWSADALSRLVVRESGPSNWTDNGLPATPAAVRRPGEPNFILGAVPVTEVR